MNIIYNREIKMIMEKKFTTMIKLMKQDVILEPNLTKKV